MFNRLTGFRNLEASNLKRLLPITRLVIFMVGAIVIVVLLFSAAEPLDQLDYARAYAEGHVRRGEWSQDQATSFFAHELGVFLRIYALQIIGVLGITWILIKTTRVIETWVNERVKGLGS